METNGTPAEQLRQVERLQTAPWVDYPPTPSWYYPAAGIWFAAMCLAGVKVLDNPMWIAAIVVLGILEAVFVVWLHRRRAATPNLRTVPTEFKPLVKWFVIAAIAICAATLTFNFAGLEVVGFIFGAVLATAGLYFYEKKFEAAADVAKARLDLA